MSQSGKKQEHTKLRFKPYMQNCKVNGIGLMPSTGT